jgi:hypothetical protein
LHENLQGNLVLDELQENFPDNLASGSSSSCETVKDTKIQILTGLWKEAPCSSILVQSLEQANRIMSAFQALNELQGKQVPRMLGCGKFENRYALVIEPVRLLTKKCIELENADKIKIMEALKAVHRQKFVFSDDDGIGLNEQCIVRGVSNEPILLPIMGVLEMKKKHVDIGRDSNVLGSLLYGNTKR